ncbi:MAG: type 4a pilus biogenesis protein PilO [Gaiellaceae bacterium]
MAMRRKSLRGLSRNAKLALVLVVLLLVGAVGYVAVVRPKQAESRALDTKLTELQTELVVQTAAAAAAGPAIRAADLFRLAKAMPDRVDMPGVLLELNEVASDAGIVFKSITPGTAVPAQGYQVLPVELQFEGDFYALSDFLFRLRNLVQVRRGGLDARGRLFAVESLAFAEAEEKFPEILATLTVDAYVYGAAPPGAAAPVPAEPATTETTTTETATTETTAEAAG